MYIANCCDLIEKVALMCGTTPPQLPVAGAAHLGVYIDCMTGLKRSNVHFTLGDVTNGMRICALGLCCTVPKRENFLPIHGEWRTWKGKSAASLPNIQSMTGAVIVGGWSVSL